VAVRAVGAVGRRRPAGVVKRSGTAAAPTHVDVPASADQRATPIRLQVPVQIRAEVVEQVNEQIRTFLAQCTQQTVLTPRGCPFRVPGIVIGAAAVRWTVEQPPVIEVVPVDEPGPTDAPAAVRTTTPARSPSPTPRSPPPAATATRSPSRYPSRSAAPSTSIRRNPAASSGLDSRTPVRQNRRHAAGGQQMTDDQLGLTMVFNGCIYNCQDLRARLENRHRCKFSGVQVHAAAPRRPACGPTGRRLAIRLRAGLLHPTGEGEVTP
jgi:hypothetical protein